MSEETQEGSKKPRKAPPPIGGIAQFATFGGSENAESSEVQTARRSEVKHAKMSEVKPFESPDKENVRMPEVQTLEQPKRKTSEDKQPERRQHTVYLTQGLSKR